MTRNTLDLCGIIIFFSTIVHQMDYRVLQPPRVFTKVKVLCQFIILMTNYFLETFQRVVSKM